MRNLSVLSISAAVFLSMLGCGEGQSISISYDRPAAYEIPASVNRIAIAEFGGQTSQDQRWGDVAADKLASVLDEYNREFQRYQLVDRKRLKGLMDERDLQVAIADTAAAAQVGKLAKVDAMIYGNVKVMTKDESAQRTTLGLDGKPKTVYYTKRYAYASVNFTMDDVGTSKTLASVTVTREYDSDKDQEGSSSLGKLVKVAGFGGDGKDTPSEQILDGLISQCVDEFVQKVSPHRVSFKEKLAGGKSKQTKTGNTLAVAGDYDEAMECYRQALVEKPEDHETMFNAGLICERMLMFDQAEQYYTSAFKIKAEQRYVNARKRVRGAMNNE